MDYYRRTRIPECELFKDHSRKSVIDHIYKYHPPSPELCWFGLPGLRWQTEKQLVARRPAWCKLLSLTGVEYLEDIINRNHKVTPFGPAAAVSLNVSPKHIDGYFAAGRRRPDQACVFQADASDFLKLEPASFVKPEGFNYWASNLTYTCGWLDWTASMSQPLLNCCKQFARRVIQNQRVPFAVTFCLGRESKITTRWLNLLTNFGTADKLGKRLDAVATVMKAATARDVEFVASETYVPPSGARMAIAYGVIDS